MDKGTFRRKLAERRENRLKAEAQPEPRYDGVFYDGLHTLDQIGLDPDVAKFINDNFWDLI